MRRRRWLLIALLFVLVAPLLRVAVAQGISETQGMGEAQEASGDPAAADAPAAAAPRTSAPGERPRISYGGVDYFLPAPREQIPVPANLTPHTVVRGDTLWGISRRFLGDPFLWPLLWEVNVASVPNPHRIYPGQQIAFPDGTVVPSATGGPETISQGAGSSPLASRAFRDSGEPNEPEYARGGFAFEDTFDPRAPRRSAPESTFVTAGFISPSDYEGPRIAEAELPHPDIGERDVVYLDIGSSNGVSAGTIYEVVRQRRPVYRPGDSFQDSFTWDQIGVLMEQVGRVQVVCVQETTSIAVVAKAYTYLERGDFIIPYTVREAPMTTGSPETDVCQPARGEARGVILDAKKGGYRTADAVTIGSGDVVYLDVGQRDSVAPGQYFVVFHPSRLGDRYPMLQIGELIVLAVEQDTATAVITDIRQEVTVGDFVQLK